MTEEPRADDPDARSHAQDRRIEHPDGFAVTVPGEWTVTVDPERGLALVALEPEPDPWGFRTNVVVTVEPLDAGMTLRAWQDGAEAQLPEALRDYLPLDSEPVRVGGQAGLRRLAHHDGQGRAMTMEQWTVACGRRGYTLTASVSTLAYPSAADQLAEIAATFRVGPDLTQSQNRRRP